MANEPTAVEKATGRNDFPAENIYANGFKVGLTGADVFMVLQRNGADFAVLNMSFTVAKSLGEALMVMIKKLEDASGRPIMTTHDASAALNGTKPPEKDQ